MRSLRQRIQLNTLSTQKKGVVVRGSSALYSRKEKTNQ